MMIAALLLMATAPDDAALFDPATGYSIASYRGVIRETPPGVRRLNDLEALRAHDQGEALFVDVTPAPGAMRDPVTGEWHWAEEHDTIPGAHWFPNAGRGDADAATNAWLARGIARSTHGSHRHPIIVFCLADCWMSWNASWKIHRLGYRNVSWYANGIDGWTEASRPLAVGTPDR